MVVVSVVVGFLFISISIPVGCLITSNCRSRKFMVFLSSSVGVNIKFGCNRFIMMHGTMNVKSLSFLSSSLYEGGLRSLRLQSRIP